MSDASPGHVDAPSLFDSLKADCAEEWDAYCNHEFVRQLGNGSLPMASFQHYLEQDYLFLIHFARAWALAVYKSERLADMRASASLLDAVLNVEMDLHVTYSERFGVTKAQMEGCREARSTMAYTRYVLERGLSGDVLDLHVALAPCVVGYAEIGRTLAALEDADAPGHPFRDWIDMYAGDEYQTIAQAAIAQLDELGQLRAGRGRSDSLRNTFREATVLEAGFWDMALTRSY